MPKNIVFCADGTWNGPGVDMDDIRYQDSTPTNVWKLFEALQGDDCSDSKLLGKEQERVSMSSGKTLQTAKYIHGVGDSNNPISKLMGGAFGVGLINRIIRGYTFISRNYSPDDNIFILGFSRGAYTARALAGLICAQGLLDPGAVGDDKEMAYIRGATAWCEYRLKRVRGDTALEKAMEDFCALLPGFVSKFLGSGGYVQVGNIAAVAVFDTVGSLGIPVYVRGDTRYDVFKFADLSLNQLVRHGLHAISIDERRADFTPTLWDARAGVTQAIFPGGHSDVGGGYPESGGQSDLSGIAMEWMQRKLADLGVLFLKSRGDYAASDPRALGMAHDESGKGPWPVLEGGRNFAARSDIQVHQNVFDRWGRDVVVSTERPAPYKPANVASFVTALGTPQPGIVVTR